MFIYIHIINHIGGVMVLVLVSCAVDRGLVYNWYWLFLRLARSIKQNEQRLVDKESG